MEKRIAAAATVCVCVCGRRGEGGHLRSTTLLVDTLSWGKGLLLNSLSLVLRSQPESVHVTWKLDFAECELKSGDKLRNCIPN